MAYSQDVRKAALRHLQAAECLSAAEKPPCRQPAVAAYLYGLAAELAIKEMMRRSGMRPTHPRQKDDPFFLHFPELKNALRNQVEGRLQGKLLSYAEDATLLQEWDTAMRYAPAADVLGKQHMQWAEQARRLVREMEDL